MEVFHLEHSLSEHYLTILRDKSTDSQQFRSAASKISLLLLMEATKELAVSDKKIDTPIAPFLGKKIETESVAVPVLRAGLGLLDGIQSLLPNLSVGYIGVQRNDETANPENYYCKLPDLNDKNIFVLEPMLATGGSLSFAISQIKKAGGSNISALCVVSAPEGIERIKKDHPDIKLYTAAIDDELNDSWYIVPGLGDMGDRLFGTL